MDTIEKVAGKKFMAKFPKNENQCEFSLWG